MKRRVPVVAADVGPSKRSRPAVAPVDGVPMRDLSAASIASNRAQLHALERILEEVKGIRTWVIAAVALAALSVVVGIVALVRGEALERRVQRIEDIILHR